jgi:hypothetical protein
VLDPIEKGQGVVPGAFQLLVFQLHLLGCISLFAFRPLLLLLFLFPFFGRFCRCFLAFREFLLCFSFYCVLSTPSTLVL